MSVSRPWIIGLAASAAVNVFLIGGLAGMAYVRLTTPAPALVSSPPTRLVAAPPAAPQPAPDRLETHPAHAAPLRPPSRPHVEDQPTPAVAAPAAEATATAAPPRPPLISAGDGLSPDSRQAFHKALSEANRLNKPLVRQARAERQAALNALAAPGYDASEVTRRLSAARALDQQARGNVEAALATFTASLSPSERATLVEGLSRVYAPAAARRAAMAGPN